MIADWNAEDKIRFFGNTDYTYSDLLIERTGENDQNVTIKALDESDRGWAITLLDTNFEALQNTNDDWDFILML